MRILVSGSDLAHCRLLKQSFHDEDYEINVSRDTELGGALEEENGYNVAILDITLPGPKGFEVLQQVRAIRQQLPIIVLTRHAQREELLQILQMGANDFVLKPYAFSELSARVQALLHCNGSLIQAVLRVQDLELDQVARKVTRAGQVIGLTPKEYLLLEYLMRNVGRLVTREQVMEHVWNLSYDAQTNVVDVYISHVRNKVDAQAKCKLIRTVRGVGYQLRP
jgi:DNA-binding response OmpR family regulator